MIYFAIFDDGTWTGSGCSPDDTLPDGAVACSAEDAQASGSWSSINNGTLVVGTPPVLRLVPPMITNAQAKMQLHAMANPHGEGTMLDVVNAAITEVGGLTEIAWTNGSALYRNGALVTKVMTAMGSTPDNMDLFFIAASKITM